MRRLHFKGKRSKRYGKTEKKGDLEKIKGGARKEKTVNLWRR